MCKSCLYFAEGLCLLVRVLCGSNVVMIYRLRVSCVVLKMMFYWKDFSTWWKMFIISIVWSWGIACKYLNSQNRTRNIVLLLSDCRTHLLWAHEHLFYHVTFWYYTAHWHWQISNNIHNNTDAEIETIKKKKSTFNNLMNNDGVAWKTGRIELCRYVILVT